MKELLGALIYNILDNAIQKADLKAWVETYAKKLVKRLTERMKDFDVEDKIQSELLDPLKEFFEEKWNINL